MYKVRKFADTWAVFNDKSGLIAQGLSCSAAMLLASRLNFEDIKKRTIPACGDYLR